MRHRIALVLMLLPLLALETACSGIRRPTRRTNSALDFLYPHQSFVGSQPAQDVVLQLPVRVGLAFAPNQNQQSDPITEEEKQVLLNRVAAAFKAHQEIGSLKVVPSPYLEAGGELSQPRPDSRVSGGRSHRPAVVRPGAVHGSDAGLLLDLFHHRRSAAHRW